MDYSLGDELHVTFHRQGLYVSGSAYVTNVGSGGMMSTARLELLYPRVSQAKFRDETSRRRGSNHVTFVKSYFAN